MTARLASTELGRFFFYPGQLHLEPTDLLVELRGCEETGLFLIYHIERFPWFSFRAEDERTL